ncbi:ring finger protein 215 [Stylonychia lemnae]|uniref:Ring finger protein 215 n=1 Tax=Stylonychia lemnae TaxID=5949 RepID=A0A077ZRN6_STYLE|nr:ring finger protein 215 [Stylonychia lemnae]|eukprot:CDW72129.1 ring finger protein 215 [Stylonychia lemnae]
MNDIVISEATHLNLHNPNNEEQKYQRLNEFEVKQAQIYKNNKLLRNLDNNAPFQPLSNNEGYSEHDQIRSNNYFCQLSIDSNSSNYIIENQSNHPNSNGSDNASIEDEKSSQLDIEDDTLRQLNHKKCPNHQELKQVGKNLYRFFKKRIIQIYQIMRDYPIQGIVKVYQYFVIGQYILISEQLMILFLLSSVLSFVLVASTKGRAQIYILSTWLFMMFYFLILHMLIKDYLPIYLQNRLDRPNHNFFIKFVVQRCLNIHRTRVQALNRSFDSLSRLQQSNRVSQVDYLLRLNLLVIQFMTQEYPSYMNTVIRYERRRQRNMANGVNSEANELFQNEQLVNQRIFSNLNNMNNIVNNQRQQQPRQQADDPFVNELNDIMMDPRVITDILTRIRGSMEMRNPMFQQPYMVRLNIQRPGRVDRPQHYEREGLSSIELLRLKSEKYEEIRGSRSQEPESCCICLDDFKQDQIIRRLQCKHSFHKDCLDQWLVRCGSCPLCKNNIVQDDS